MLPADFLFLFLERLAGDTERRDGAGLQSLIWNLFLAAFTDAIGILVQPLQRFVDLFEQLLFPFLDPHREVLVDLSGGLIAHVGKGFWPFTLREPLPHLVQNRLTLFLELSPDGAVLSAGAPSPGGSLCCD